MESKTLKVMTVFGTRPEIIRLSRIFAKLDEYINHIMVHTGQSYDFEMNQVFFDDLQVRKPDYFLNVKSDTLGGQIANIIKKSEEVFLKEKPDAVLVLGDTNSSLAAIVAKRMKIPVFHMEAGNRSFDENVPEEVNRKIVDHISDVNMAYSENARAYLLLENINPGTIFVVGSPFAEILSFYGEKISKSEILKELKLKAGEYIVASIHREENIDSQKSLSKLMEALNAIVEKYKIPVIFSVHPRTRAKLNEYKIEINEKVKLMKPFGYFDYVNLQKNAFCVISDSGTIQEESSILNFPAIQARVSSERPESFDEGNLILSGLDKDIILQAIDITVRQMKSGEKFKVPQSYSYINVSSKVLRIIVGFSKIIKNKREN